MRVIGIGAGGHAKVMIEILRLMGGCELVGLLDREKALQDREILGVRVLGDDTLLPALYAKGLRHAFLGIGTIGDTSHRRSVYESVRRAGFQMIRVVHPQAVIAPSATIGEGLTIMASVVINAEARIGTNVIVNTGAIVEHDCIIGDHAHVATGARLSGGVEVKDGAHIGVGAAIKQGVTIGAGAIVGAGAVVIRDVKAGSTVVGNPAYEPDQHLVGSPPAYRDSREVAA